MTKKKKRSCFLDTKICCAWASFSSSLNYTWQSVVLHVHVNLNRNQLKRNALLFVCLFVCICGMRWVYVEYIWYLAHFEHSIEPCGTARIEPEQKAQDSVTRTCPSAETNGNTMIIENAGALVLRGWYTMLQHHFSGMERREGLFPNCNIQRR